MDWVSLFSSFAKRSGPLTLTLALFIQFVTWLYFDHWNPPSLTPTQFAGDFVVNVAISIVCVAIYRRFAGRNPPSKQKDHLK
jgi:hypothetical protein